MDNTSHAAALTRPKRFRGEPPVQLQWFALGVLGTLMAGFIGINAWAVFGSDSATGQPVVFYTGSLYEDCGEILSDGDFVLSCSRLASPPAINTPTIEATEPRWRYQGKSYGRCHIIEAQTGMDRARLVCVLAQS